VPESKTVVLFDESVNELAEDSRQEGYGILSMEIRDEEHRSDNQDTKKDSQNDSRSLAGTHLFKSWDTMASTDDDEQGEDASCEGVVEWDESKCPLHRICSRVHQKLDGQEYHGTEASCDRRSNSPRRRDL